MLSYSWFQGMRRDGLQLSNRLQTVIRFQIATNLQIYLNDILEPNMQLPIMFLLIVGTELGVRHYNIYPLKLLRSVVVIQSGQCLLRYIASLSQNQYPSKYMQTRLTSWMITTASLCLPGMLGTKSTSNTYINNAVTVFLYQYTAATRSMVQIIDLGISPLYIAILCVVFALRLNVWKTPEIQADALSLHVYFFKAFHMLIVEILLFSLESLSKPLNAFCQLMLQMIVVLTIDTINHKQQFEEIRGYSIWRVSRLILNLNFNSNLHMNAMLTCGVAILVFFSRRLPWVHSMYTSARSTHTLAEIVFLVSMNLILKPISTQTNAHVQMQLLLILIISIIAQSIDFLITDKSPENTKLHKT